MKFTAKAVDALMLPVGKTDHIEFDDTLPGFGIRLRTGGKRSYIVQYRAGGHQRRETLGDVRKLDLDQARRAAKRRLGAVALGHDPAAEKAEARDRARHTLGAVLPRFLERKRAVLRPPSLRPVERHLVRRWAPLHHRPVHEITRREVATRLAELTDEYGANSARVARAVLSEFFSWAAAEGLVEQNPVAFTNEPPRNKPRDRVLSDPELAAVWRAAEGAGEYGIIVRLLILTACRRDEIADLRWDEIGADAVLRIPGKRVKNHRELVLPLPLLVLTVLEEISCCRLGRERRVFGRGMGGYGGYSQSKRALDASIAATGVKLEPWRLHDLRRSAATGLANLGAPPHTIEAVLNHAAHRAGVSGTYNLGSYEREVRAALALWADHIEALVKDRERKIVPLRA